MGTCIAKVKTFFHEPRLNILNNLNKGPKGALYKGQHHLATWERIRSDQVMISLLTISRVVRTLRSDSVHAMTSQAQLQERQQQQQQQHRHKV